jgi:hypothetical protein
LVRVAVEGFFRKIQGPEKPDQSGVGFPARDAPDEERFGKLEPDGQKGVKSFRGCLWDPGNLLAEEASMLPQRHSQ